MPKPVIHGRDHAPGGADPIPFTPAGGVQFDTYPQQGQWLYIETDGTDLSPSGFGVEIFDESGGGIDLGASSGGQILLQTTGGGDIVIQASAALRLISGAHHVIVPSLPTSDPGVPGALWNDSGTLKIS